MSTPRVKIRRWQFGGAMPYDVIAINENRTVAYFETAQQCFDFVAATFPGEPVTVDIQP